MQFISLSHLVPGQRAIVRSLQSAGPMRRRLQELGLIPGTSISCYWTLPGGTSSVYQFRGTLIALRAQDSCGVLTEPLSEGASQWV